MNQHPRPDYLKKDSTQTLHQGLEEYYAVNSNITNPKDVPLEFAQILRAHDVSHIIFGCDTRMYDELKLLPLTWWTSDYQFSDHLRTLQDPIIRPAIRIMYDDIVKQQGSLRLWGSILWVLPQLWPELGVIWFKTRKRQKVLPFLNFEPLLDRPLLEIRQEFELLDFIK